MSDAQVPSETLLARIETWLRDKHKGQKYACVQGYRRNERERNCEGCLLMEAKAEIQNLKNMLHDYQCAHGNLLLKVIDCPNCDAGAKHE